MKKNMGKADRIIRIILAVIFSALYLTHTITGMIGLVLMILAVVFLLTSFISFCPLYTIFGLRTCAAEKS